MTDMLDTVAGPVVEHLEAARRLQLAKLHVDAEAAIVVSGHEGPIVVLGGAVGHRQVTQSQAARLLAEPACHPGLVLAQVGDGRHGTGHDIGHPETPRARHARHRRGCRFRSIE